MILSSEEYLYMFFCPVCSQRVLRLETFRSHHPEIYYNQYPGSIGSAHVDSASLDTMLRCNPWIWRTMYYTILYKELKHPKILVSMDGSWNLSLMISRHDYISRTIFHPSIRVNSILIAQVRNGVICGSTLSQTPFPIHQQTILLHLIQNSTITGGNNPALLH